MDSPKATPPETTVWHLQPVEEVFSVLQGGADSGLSGPEALSRLESYGLKELAEQGRPSPLVILRDQFASTMVLILVAAVVITPDMKNSPWAKLIMPTMSYTNVYPIAIMAYRIRCTNPNTNESNHTVLH